MINLLLPEHKLALRREYRRRLLVVAGSIILAALLSTLIIEASFYLVIVMKKRTLEGGLATVGHEAESAHFDELKQALVEANNQVKVLLVPERAVALSQIVEELSAVRQTAPGITLGEIVYNGTAGSGSLNLKGFAETRQNFLGFIKLLEDQPLIAEVTHPIGDLVKERKINFSLMITLASLPAKKP